jgi:hypothetical protein
MWVKGLIGGLEEDMPEADANKLIANGQAIRILAPSTQSNSDPFSNINDYAFRAAAQRLADRLIRNENELTRAWAEIASLRARVQVLEGRRELSRSAS